MPLVDNLLKILFTHTITTQPGFIIEKFGNRQLRNTFLSENALAGIENSVSKTAENEPLYQSGKDFGYNYAKAIPLPHADFPLRDSVFRQLLQFLEMTIGTCEDYKIDWNEKRIALSFKELAVCRKNGNGALLTGAIAGLSAYLFNDKTIEGIQINCQGRGENKCYGVTMPSNKFENRLKPPKYSDLEEDKPSREYEYFNNAIPFQPEYGLDVLGRIGLVKYESRMFEVFGERFIPLEISFIYRLENKLKKKNLDLEKTVYAPVFKAFQNLGQNSKRKYEKLGDAMDFTSKFLSALGWGIIQTVPQKQPTISVTGFPWTPELEQLKESQYFLGSVDGLLTGLTGKKVRGETRNLTKQKGHYDFAISF